MRNKIIVGILRQLYIEFLRELIVQHVEKTDTNKDDMIIHILDTLLVYHEPFVDGVSNG